MKFKKELAELVKVKGSANLIEIQNEFHAFAVKTFGELINPQERVDYSLIRVLCNWVENGIEYNSPASDSKVSKRDIVLEEYAKLKGGIDENEKKLIEKYIEDLHNHNDIKKVSFWRWARKTLLSYLKKKNILKK